MPETEPRFLCDDLQSGPHSEPAPHSVRKRAYAPHYATSNLALYQPEMHDSVGVLLQKMDLYNGKKALDCLVLFRRLFVDILFVSSFGQRFNSLDQWDILNFSPDPAAPMVEAINLFPLRGIARSYLPKPIWDLVIRIPIAGWKKLVDSDKTVSPRPYHATLCSPTPRQVASYVIQARDNIVSNDPTFRLTGNIEVNGLGDERLSLIHRLLRQSLNAKPEDKLGDRDIISEAMGHT